MTNRTKHPFLPIPYIFCAYLTLVCILFSSAATAKDTSPEKIKKVVIDPGHGGKDPGTCYKNIHEKNIVLSVSLKLGKLIKKHYPEIEVIYTRDKDVFVELHERGNIANKHHADLFISIHVNGVDNSAASGTETYVMGWDKSADNMAVAQRENSVITYESDFTSKYEGYDPKSPESFIIFSLMQNVHLDQSLLLASEIQKEFGKNPIKVNRGVKQDRFLVLWKTAMPSVLVELGFISNANDRKVLTDNDNQDKMAEQLFRAFCSYKKSYERDDDSNSQASSNSAQQSQPNEKSADTNTSKPATNEPATTTKDDDKSSNNNSTYYRVQIMSLATKEPLNSKIFKNHKDIRIIKAGALYKYMIGNTTSRQEAVTLSKKLQKDFPGAFPIAVRNEAIIPMK